MFFSKFKDRRIKEVKMSLVDEQKSPLFRIMSVYNDNDSAKRKFANNICAFHVGKGYILSVAHNLRSTVQYFQSIPENEYQSQIIQKLDTTQTNLFNQIYTLDNQTNLRHLTTNNVNDLQQLTVILNQINYDTRWVTFYQRQICKPFLIIQFRTDKFYNSETLTQKINSNHIFHESQLSRHTFLLELELVEAFYNEDISIYQIVNTDEDIIKNIPFSEIDFNIYDKTDKNFFCLQSAPVDNLGRLLNEARIEGLLDHWNKFNDKFGGNYIMEGLRYLIKGYFRFGSSGAPYFKYDNRSKTLKINAIQSEASPIQLSINNNRNGNFQYINAIASPVYNVEKNIKRIMNI